MRWALITAAVMLAACTNSGEPDYPAPPAVIIVPHSPDTASVEKGIDAVPETDAIKLEWYRTNDINVRFYNIYRKAEDETFFSKIKTINIESVSPPFDTTYFDGDSTVTIEKYFSYFITATSKDGIEGARSDTVRYKLLSKATTDRPNNEELTTPPVFEWTFDAQSGIPNSYILRIEEEISEKKVFAQKLDVVSFDWRQVLDFSQVDTVGVLQSGIRYRWRIDTIGQDEETSGAESEWKTFRMN